MFVLQREEVEEASSIPNRQTWPVRISAFEADATTPAKIFVYHAGASPLPDKDFFSCVAGAPQMTELPEDSPEEGVPFYRTSTLLIYARSPSHATEFWNKIQRAVQDLADNLSLVDALALVETVTITPDT